MGNVKKVYHANMLKLYIERDSEDDTNHATDQTQTATQAACQSSTVYEDDPPVTIDYEDIVGDDYCPQYTTPANVAVLSTEDEDAPLNLELVELPDTQDTSTWQDTHIDENLDPDQVKDVERAFQEFKQCLKETPGASKGKVTHTIRVTTDTPSTE